MPDDIWPAPTDHVAGDPHFPADINQLAKNLNALKEALPFGADGTVTDGAIATFIEDSGSDTATALAAAIAAQVSTVKAATVFVNPGATTQQAVGAGAGGSGDGTNPTWWYGDAPTTSNNFYDLFSETFLGQDAADAAAGGGQLDGDTAAINPTKIQVVVHSQNGNKPRPTVATGVIVWWVGPAYPVHATSSDLWTAHSLPTLFAWVGFNL